MDTLIQLTDITKRFGGVTALDRVTLSIAQGECHARMGENLAARRVGGGCRHRAPGTGVLP